MITITIEGTDRTRLVEYTSMRIVNILTQEPDTCSFNVRKFGSRSFVPGVGEEVVITENGTKIFAGKIQKVNEKYDKLDLVSYIVRCTDYTRDMDQRLIVEVFENKTVAEIIQSIKDNWLPNAFTINNALGVTTLINRITLNYEYPSQVLKQLAEVSGSDWYVDFDRDIHFFEQSSPLAPFNLTDNGGKYIYESLNIRRDLSQLRNTIIVRGGEFLGDTITAAYNGDGTRRNFFTPHKFSNVSLTVTGEEKSVGTDIEDPETNFDALYNFDEKVMKFREDRKPSSGAEVKIIGKPNLPVISKVRDTASIETFTAREHLIIDPSIGSKEAARDRARAELLIYKTTISEGRFRTYTAGLFSGQKINVQSDLRSIDDDFIINKVETRIFGVNGSDNSVRLEYTISLITTRTFEFIQLLQRLINKDRKDIVISDDEILDEVESVDENMSLAETITASVVHNPIEETMDLSELVEVELDSGIEFVWGNWTAGREEGIKRQAVFGGSLWQ